MFPNEIADKATDVFWGGKGMESTGSGIDSDNIGKGFLSWLRSLFNH